MQSYMTAYEKHHHKLWLWYYPHTRRI